MSDSVKSNVEDISEMIFKNVHGEIILTKSMRTAQKISNSDSLKHQDNDVDDDDDDDDDGSRMEDSKTSNVENIHYVVFKSDDEVTHTFVRVSDDDDDDDSDGMDECGTGSASSQVSRTIASLMSEYNRDHKPQHPQFSSKTKRLHTFIDWPRGMRQKPEDLAEAGFFYTGSGDRTMCFHCGGGLKDWEDDDDPWQQHVQWFSGCAYVKKLTPCFM